MFMKSIILMMALLIMMVISKERDLENPFLQQTWFKLQRLYWTTHWVDNLHNFLDHKPIPQAWVKRLESLEIKSSSPSSNDKEAWFLNKFFPAPWRTEAIPKCEATQGLSWRVDLGESPTPVRQWVQNSSNWRLCSAKMTYLHMFPTGSSLHSFGRFEVRAFKLAEWRRCKIIYHWLWFNLNGKPQYETRLCTSKEPLDQQIAAVIRSLATIAPSNRNMLSLVGWLPIFEHAT